MKWVLPPKFREAEANKEVNPEEPQPLNNDKGNGGGRESKPSKPGKLGDDPRFSEALKNSGYAQGQRHLCQER